MRAGKAIKAKSFRPSKNNPHISLENKESFTLVSCLVNYPGYRVNSAKPPNAGQFIENLPQGYETVLGRWFDKGEEISLGEWQKIVLARAFLRDSPFIILDEPTSSLDTQTEYYLFKNFRELIAGHSALLISHRFSTVRMADRIYVLDGNTIAEHGTHRQLMQQGGIYADMYNKQAAWLDAPN